jgi:hypothetical protein
MYKIIILPVVLYVYETWPLTLREEHTPRVFEKRVLRRIFEPTRNELSGGWRKLHNEELHNLNSWPRIIRMTKSRKLRWGGNVARMGEKRKAYRILMGKPKEKGPLRRPRHRLVDNIKMDLRKIKRGGMDWIDLAQDRDWWRTFVNIVMNLRVP